MFSADKQFLTPASPGGSLLRQFLEHAPAAIAMFDREMRYLAASRRYCRDFRIEEQGLVGRCHYEVFPEIPEQWKEVHRRCLAGATERVDADPFPRGDGLTDWLHWEIQPWRTEAGDIGGLLLYCEVITEQVRLQQQLRDSEEFHRTLLKDMPDLVCRVRSDGALTSVSDSYCQRFGKSREELLGNSFMPLIPEDDWPAVSAFFESLGPDNPVSAITHRVITEDDQVRWMEWVDRCLFDETGAVREYQCTGRDVTDRKQAEDQLRISNLIVEQSPMVVFRWRVAPGWPVEYVSENVHQWGYSAKGLMAGEPTYTEIIHPDDLESVLREVDEDLASGLHRFVQQYRIVTGAGEVRWVEDHTTVERDATGRAVLMQGIVRDVHERKLDEEQLQMQSAALEATTNAILIADRGGRIEWANRAYLECCGCTLDEAKGRLPDELVSAEIPGTTDRSSAWSAVREGRAWHGEVVVRRDEGQPRTKEMTITPVRDTAGEIKRFIAVLQDITDRLALEKRSHRSQRLESIGLLTGGVAHDFNNLLTVALGSAEQLQEIVGDDQPLGQLARTITQVAMRGAELNHQLLAFARQLPLSPRVLDVRELVTGMQSMLRRTLGEHINIDLQLEEGLWCVHADAAQLESALLNLLINARDAMSGGGQLHISAHNATLAHPDAKSDPVIEPGEYVVLTVTDTGCGITPEQLEHVLEPFFTTKESGKGTGLGLPMVYGFIRQSNGHLHIESEPGVGTCVRIHFPRTEEQAAVTTASPERTTPPRGTGTILVVEDDDMVRHYAEAQLATLGYRVLCACNGPEGLDIVRTRDDIDLVFTDMVMPGGMSGRDLAVAVRAVRPDIKVLYTTGYGDLGSRDPACTDPAAQVLAKPYRREDLARKVHEMLASRGESPRAT